MWPGATENAKSVLPWIVSIHFDIHPEGAFCGVGNGRTQIFLCFFGHALPIGSVSSG